MSIRYHSPCQHWTGDILLLYYYYSLTNRSIERNVLLKAESENHWFECSTEIWYRYMIGIKGSLCGVALVSATTTKAAPTVGVLMGVGHHQLFLLLPLLLLLLQLLLL